MVSHRTTARGLLLLLAAGVFAGTAHAASVPDLTAFPVTGNVTYIDDFGDPRPGGVSHQGNDVMSVRHQPAVAFEAGWVEKWSHPDGAVPSCMLVLHGKSGMVYWYINLNNDLGPGYDNDGRCRKAYAPGLGYHDHVRRGQLVGFVGDSGDANGIQPHLHFELHTAGGRAIDPYKYLRAAKPLLFPRPRPILGDMTLTLKGATVTAKTAGAITVRTKRILTDPLGLDYINRRTVTLDAGSATVKRKSSTGSLAATTVSQAKVGERVRIRTAPFAPGWARQRAGAGELAAASILLLAS